MDKEIIKQHCLKIVSNKLAKLQKAIKEYQNDLLSETKSSAGDKHETGRAMLQLEMEKLGHQYQTVLIQKESLIKIIISDSKIARTGSLVYANNNYYFLATSIGQVKINNKTIMVVSINSPIGKLLVGKKEQDLFLFNGQQIKVIEVV